MKNDIFDVLKYYWTVNSSNILPGCKNAKFILSVRNIVAVGPEYR